MFPQGEMAQYAMELLDASDDVQSRERFSFRAHRMVNDEFWLTKSLNEISVKHMETEHVKSCVKLLRKAKQTDTKAYEGLTKELTRRGVNYEF